MRVRMIKTLSNDRQEFVEDREYEIPDDRATQWIGAGVASEAPFAPGQRRSTLTADQPGRVDAPSTSSATSNSQLATGNSAQPRRAAR